MRSNVLVAVAVASLLGGCASNGGRGGGGSGGTGGGGAAGSGGGGGTAVDMALTVTDAGVQTGVFSVGIGPIPVPAGQETTQCIVMRMPTTAPVDVVAIETTLAAGSHHLIVYRSTATQEALTPAPCSSFQGVEMGEPPIFIAESPHSVLTMPTGVAYHFPAGQMVRIEAHYLNATTQDIMGMGTVLFTAGASGNYQPADIMMCGNVPSLYTPGVVPGASTLPPGFYGGGSDVDFTKLKIFGVTSHEHQLGTDVKIWKSTGKTNPNTSTPLYDNPSWDNPPLLNFGDQNLISFGPGEGLEWQCSYNNPGTNTVQFGPSAQKNEMCFIWAYYFPSVGRFIAQNDCWAN